MIEPTFNPETNVLTIPRVAGVTHYIDDSPVRGTVVLTEDTTVTAKPNKGSHFREDTTTEWTYKVEGSGTPSQSSSTPSTSGQTASTDGEND